MPPARATSGQQKIKAVSAACSRQLRSAHTSTVANAATHTYSARTSCVWSRHVKFFKTLLFAACFFLGKMARAIGIIHYVQAIDGK
jgi:hypothetical protein